MASSSNDLSRVSGSKDMAKPEPSRSQAGRQPTAPAEGSAAPKKKRHRGGKNRKKRRQSFIAPSENESAIDTEERPSMPNARQSANKASFYRLGQGNRSNTSLESEALLDHREQQVPTARRRSIQQGFARPSMPFARQQHRGSSNSMQQPSTVQRSRPARDQRSPIGEDDDEDDTNDRTPLLSRGNNQSRPDLPRHPSAQNYGASQGTHRTRRSSNHSKASSKKRGIDIGAHRHPDENEEDYDVNNPPSVPNSPQLGSLDDIMVADLTNNDRGRDAIINIDYEDNQDLAPGSPDARRRTTVADLAERDVCFPGDGSLSDGGDADDDRRSRTSSRRLKRRRTKQWPDLDVLDEFSREEKEARTQEEYLRVKKISEPVMVEGRLRHRKAVPWHREEDDAPFRFTYFNELFDSTIHARTISDLCQDGGSFRDLFIPDPVELSDTSDSEPEDESAMEKPPPTAALNGGGDNNATNLRAAAAGMPGDLGVDKSESNSKSNTGSNTPSGRNRSTTPAPFPPEKAHTKRYGNRPTFWLDVLQPTEIEMKVLAKAFGIHQLTIEDILMDEPREKVELFQSYYFVNYRSFEQDKDNEDYMEPINMYVVVFRDGVITFHHSMTPHPANVRRRIRQLNDYMSPTADWISYAIIDDVTDVYAPLVQQIEEEVDDIDDEILYLHTNSADAAVPKDSKGKPKANQSEKGDAKNQGDMGTAKTEGEKTAGESGGDMLRRVGECRKKVMGLYRLLGNKADVIKGFAKRCNEHWEVAPRSEIGLYLGDIQDHIVTMTGNLSHYENLLSRAHSNYLAQINIRMNERAEQTADVLGKLTVLGTIVLPMNIVTGMWGMNVWVPGQEYEGNLAWFWCITAGLFMFGITCYFIAKRVYGIV